jgi:hypothetical protein
MTKCIRWIKQILKYVWFNFIFKKRYEYPALDEDTDNGHEEYYALYYKNTEDVRIDMKKIKAAYNKAWEIRNFEIDKYWQRTAYFWGFIAIIFVGYISVITNIDNVTNKYLEFYLISLGLIFSIGWFFVLLGSKTWYENWEGHIDLLEEYISGPLYRIVRYRGRMFYSVSKINEILAIVVCLVWLGLFFQYLLDNYRLVSPKQADWPATITCGVVLIVIFIIAFGYPVDDYKSTKGKFFNRWEWNDNKKNPPDKTA